MKQVRLIQTLVLLFVISVFFQSCDDDDNATPQLEVPTTYTSANFDANVTAERTVRTELASLTTRMNEEESKAASGDVIFEIIYPSNLSAVTLASYKTKIDVWLEQLVLAAVDRNFVNPGLNGTPTAGDDGGILGTRLLDENGLELEQMVEKGSFGAASYNHALTLINGEKTDATTDKLIEIFGTDQTFDVTTTTQAATYARRRSNLTAQTGLFFDMRDNLLTAQAAIAAGDAFNTQRDQALADFKLNWEKSNFATVIFYCNAAKDQLTAATTDEERGNAMHAYAEGVAFAAGWRGLSDKQITDDQIDDILELLLAPYDGTPESHKFLNDATLLNNFDQIITIIQGVYDFTDEEVTGFFVNNNP